METRIVKEKPLYSYYGRCPQFGQEIELYQKDLKDAKIGRTWSCEDQNRYPNRDQTWRAIVQVVYRNGNNVYLHCYCTRNDYRQYDELVAIEMKD